MMVLSLLAKALLVIFATWTTPRTWVPGELVTASMMNIHVRDNLNSIRTESFAVQAFRNLQLRTHPDGDIAVTTVQFAADEIVMDDSTRLAYTTPINVAITAAGANGLDTGAEGASRWYEVYAIAKDDGTKAGLLHRAKDFLLDANATTDLNGEILRFASGTPTDKMAQSFTVTVAGPVTFVDILMRRLGSPVGNIWLTIETNSAGNPSGTQVGTGYQSDKLNAALLSTSSQWVRFVFRNPSASLALTTTYHLVLQGDYTKSDANAVIWRRASTSVYANGSLRYLNGVTWTDQAVDAAFKIYVTENDTAVTMPSGYTKKARIGWVYNNSGSDFVVFLARGRRVWNGQGATAPAATFVSAVTTTFPVLYDVSAYIPPVPCLMMVSIGNATAAAASIAGGVPDGIEGYTHYPGIQQRVYDPSAGGAAQAPNIAIPTDTQGIYVWAASGSAYCYAGGFEW